MAADRVPLEASRSNRPEDLHGRADPPPATPLEATILVRRRPDSATHEQVERILRGEAEPIPRDQAGALLGADPADLRRIADFAAAYGLTVTASDPDQRSVRVAGTVAQMESAFGVKLRETGGRLFYEGALAIPSALDGLIVGVLGLDQRPVATH